MRTMMRPMIDYLQSKVSGQLPRMEEVRLFSYQIEQHTQKQVDHDQANDGLLAE